MEETELKRKKLKCANEDGNESGHEFNISIDTFSEKPASTANDKNGYLGPRCGFLL